MVGLHSIGQTIGVEASFTGSSHHHIAQKNVVGTLFMAEPVNCILMRK